VACYVDDIIIASSNDAQKLWLKAKFCSKYRMTDCGDLNWFLGMRITRDRRARTITVDQERYILTILDRFGLNDCNPCSTPAVPGLRLDNDMSATTEEEIEYIESKPFRSAVGSLMYAMVATRPDIASALCVVCRFMNRPGRQHWKAVKQILKYLKGHSSLGLTFSGSSGINAYGFSDSDWAGDRNSRRSTTGYVFMLAGAAISWKSKLQKTPSLSSTEAEYMAAGAAVQEALSIRYLLEELGYIQSDATNINVDNKGAICLALSQGSNYGTRHIALRHHFLRHYVASGDVKLTYIHTSKNVADVLTKALSRQLFEFFRSKMLGLFGL
jgi:hypothetical protein